MQEQQMNSNTFNPFQQQQQEQGGNNDLFNKDNNDTNQPSIFDNNNNQDQQGDKQDIVLKNTMIQKNQNKRIEIRKQNTQKIFEQQRINLKKKRDLIEFTVDDYRKLINELTNVNTQNFDGYIEQLDKLCYYDYESDGYSVYQERAQTEFSSDVNLASFVFKLHKDHPDYEKLTEAIFELLKYLTRNSNVCIQLVQTGFLVEVMKVFENSSNDEITLFCMDILINLTAEDASVIKNQVVELQIFYQIQLKSLTEVEYIEHCTELMLNYSFNQNMKQEEIYIGLKLISQLCQIINCTQSETIDMYTIFQETLGTLTNLAIIMDKKFQSDSQFDYIECLLDYILQIFQQHMVKLECTNLMIKILSVCASNPYRGIQFFRRFEEYYKMLYMSRFTFIRLFTQCIFISAPLREEVVEFLKKYPEILENVIQKIAFQNNATAKERVAGLKLIEAIVDKVKNTAIVYEMLAHLGIEDAVVYNLNPESDPSITSSETMVRLEIIDALIDHGNHFQQNNDNQQQIQEPQEFQSQNQFLNRFNQLGVADKLQNLALHDDEDIRIRASNVYDTQFTDLYS